MSFKDRLSNINMSDPKTAGIMGALGGAGIGAANAYFGNAGEDLATSRENDIQDWISGDAKDDLMDKTNMSKGDFTDARDAFIGGHGHKHVGGYIGGQIEDMAPMTSPEEHRFNLQTIMRNNPDMDMKINAPHDMSDPEHLFPGKASMQIRDYTVDPSIRSDVAWDKFDKGQKGDIMALSDDEVRSKIAGDKDLSRELSGMEADVKTSDSDAIKRGMAGGLLAGGALAGGGAFATRKLKDRYGK